MSSSLILGPFDLLDPASPVRLEPAFDRGAGVPTVSQIQSSVLDGSAVTGVAAGNRQITLPLVIRATTRVNGATLANQVLQFVDQASWQLMFTPDGGFPVVYDCYRATSTVTSDLVQDAQGFQSLLIVAQALPYGRSPLMQSISLTGTSTQVEGFNSTAPTVTATPGSGGGSVTVTSVALALSNGPYIVPFEGAKMLEIDYQKSSRSAQFAISKTGLSVLVSVAPTTAKLQARVPPGAYLGGVSVWSLQLVTDRGTFTCPVIGSPLPGSGSWTAVTFDVSAVPAGATISAWTVTTPFLDQRNTAHDTSTTSLALLIDDFRVFPAVATGVSDGFGGTYLLPGLVGTARAPIALAVTKSGGGNFISWIVHTPPPGRSAAQALIPLAGAASGASYTTASSVRYNGTYSVWLAPNTIYGSTQTFTVTFTQSLPTGSGGTVSVSATLSPSLSSQLLYIGDVILPVASYPPETAVTTTVTVTSTVTTTTYSDVLLLDTRGQSVVVDSFATPQPGGWIDLPDPTQSFGGIWTGPNRGAATSVASHLLAGSVLLQNPGDSQILLYSQSGSLVGTAYYYPHWLQEATQ